MRNVEVLRGIRARGTNNACRQTRILEISKDKTVDFICSDGYGGRHAGSRMAELENKTC